TGADAWRWWRSSSPSLTDTTGSIGDGGSWGRGGVGEFGPQHRAGDPRGARVGPALGSPLTGQLVDEQQPPTGFVLLPPLHRTPSRHTQRAGIERTVVEDRQTQGGVVLHHGGGGQ